MRPPPSRRPRRPGRAVAPRRTTVAEVLLLPDRCLVPTASIACLQPRNAASRWADAKATTTARSPTASLPFACAMQHLACGSCASIDASAAARRNTARDQRVEHVVVDADALAALAARAHRPMNTSMPPKASSDTNAIASRGSSAASAMSMTWQAIRLRVCMLILRSRAAAGPAGPPPAAGCADAAGVVSVAIAGGLQQGDGRVRPMRARPGLERGAELGGGRRPGELQVEFRRIGESRKRPNSCRVMFMRARRRGRRLRRGAGDGPPPGTRPAGGCRLPEHRPRARLSSGARAEAFLARQQAHRGARRRTMPALPSAPGGCPALRTSAASGSWTGVSAGRLVIAHRGIDEEAGADRAGDRVAGQAEQQAAAAGGGEQQRSPGPHAQAVEADVGTERRQHVRHEVVASLETAPVVTTSSIPSASQRASTGASASGESVTVTRSTTSAPASASRRSR